MNARVLPLTMPHYGLYEAMKAQWRDQHPEATPDEYDRAMTRVTAECGV